MSAGCVGFFGEGFEGGEKGGEGGRGTRGRGREVGYDVHPSCFGNLRGLFHARGRGDVKRAGFLSWIVSSRKLKINRIIENMERQRARSGRAMLEETRGFRFRLRPVA